MSDPKLDHLRGVPLFATCNEMDLERNVAPLVDEVDVPDRYVIAQEGRREGQFAIIVEGTVRLERDGKAFHRIGPGEYIGEMALIDDGPRTASAVSEGPVKLLVMAPREFRSLMDESLSVRASVLETLARRIRRYEADIPH
jgi:CRP/FNR family cyclic AMP-dependent transcriptional regulator